MNFVLPEENTTVDQLVSTPKKIFYIVNKKFEYSTEKNQIEHRLNRNFVSLCSFIFYLF